MAALVARSLEDECMNHPRTSDQVADSLDAMVGYWDMGLQCRYANSAYKVWFGRSQDDMMGISMQKLLGPLFELNLPYIAGAIRGEPQRFERIIPLPDGSLRHSLASYYPDFSEGALHGFSVHVADITDIKQRQLSLELACANAESRAAHDFLTGLPNRFTLLRSIDAAIEQAAAQATFAAIVIMDLDNFKTINDSYGHLFGDAVLQAIAERMQLELRNQQSVVRYGGDEFVFIVPNVTSQVGVAQMIQRFTAAVCQPMIINGIHLSASLSCGVALYPIDGTTSPLLLENADAALYRAKKQHKGSLLFATSLSH
jgi:diguanylate cyclase (GGDEF)-like protein/PAS domain S-box-containing protein